MAIQHNTAAACFKHVDRAVNHVMGNRKSKEVRIHNVSDDKDEWGRSAYVCFCGKKANYYIREIAHEEVSPTIGVNKASGQG